LDLPLEKTLHLAFMVEAEEFKGKHSLQITKPTKREPKGSLAGTLLAAKQLRKYGVQ
jgi:hypothetical protein